MNKIYLYLLIVVGITLAGYIGLLKVENGDLKTDIQRLNRELVIEKAQGAIYESDISNLKKTISDNNSLIDSMKIERDKLSETITIWKQQATDEKIRNEKLKVTIKKYSDANATGEACLEYNREISRLKYKEL